MTDAKKRELLRMTVAAAVVAAATAVIRATWWWRLQLSGPKTWRIAVAAVVAAALGLLCVLHVTLRWPPKRGIVVVAAGLAVGLPVGRNLAGDAYVGPVPPAESRCSDRLFDVLTEQVSSGQIRGDFQGRTIAVVERARVRSAAARVRDAIISRRPSHFVVVVGGPHADLVDEVCRRAVRWLPACRRGNITIVLVTPQPVSDNTRQVLKDKGLKVIEVEHQFPDHL